MTKQAEQTEQTIPNGYLFNKAGQLACKRCGHPEKCHERHAYIDPNERAPQTACVEFQQPCAC